MVKKKLKSHKGETIAETMVALLIAALALVMLAGAISAASSIIQKSKAKLNEYYEEDKKASGVVKMSSGGTDVTDGITITDTDERITSPISLQKQDITWYMNDKFSGKTVVAYKVKD